MPRKKLPKDKFVFRDEWLRWLVDEDGFEWSPQECKELLMAIRAYRLHLEMPIPSNRYMKDKINYCITAIKETDKSYEEQCEINRRKAKSYWEKLYSESQEEVHCGTPEDAAVNQCVHDNDSDSDNDSDKVSIETKTKKQYAKKAAQKKAELSDADDGENPRDEVEIFQVSTEDDYYPNEGPAPDSKGDFAIQRKPAKEDGKGNLQQSSSSGDAPIISPYSSAKTGEIYEVGGKRCIKRGQGKVFAIPTIAEIQSYINEKGYHVQANTFFDYYDNASPPWTYRDSGGRIKPVQSWKQCLSTFESHFLRSQGARSLSQQNNNAGYQVLNNTDYEQI